MNKLVGFIAIMAAASVASAQGPYSMNIGTGVGSLAITAGASTGIYGNGMIQGDVGVFNDGGTPRSTIWKTFWLLRNDTDNLNYYSDNSAAHTTKLPAGTFTANATSISNNGFTLGGTAQTGSLAITLTQPVVGDTSKISYAWTINNGAAVPKNYRIIFHMDTDNYLVTNNYEDDLVGRTASLMGGSHALGLGEPNGSGGANLNSGVLIDTDRPNTYFGMSNSNGPSNWWTSATGYTTNGMDLTHSIQPSISNTLENNTVTVDSVSDSGADSGGALQVNFTVPATSSSTVNFSATWGANQVITPSTSVSDWTIYN